MKKMHRYPGVRPFEPEDKALFFGRDLDISDLCEMVRAERLVVLFGKSGYGKSSLLNAGVVPKLRSYMKTFEVRFNEWDAKQTSLLKILVDKTPLPVKLRSNAQFLGKLEQNLWTHFKQLENEEKNSYLLVFDQFEEFFSYPVKAQRAFCDELADLMSDELPESLRETVRGLDREQRRLLSAPVDVRVLFSIRSDRMHELDSLKDRLPAILHKRYELKPLRRDQAKKAIVGPAALIDPRPDLREGRIISESEKDTWAFVSKPFTYEGNCLDKILDYLAGSDPAQQKGVETWHLQVLCESIESQVAERHGMGETYAPPVSVDDLPDFEDVLNQYYKRKLALLGAEKQISASFIIEEGLVSYNAETETGRRRSVDVQTLLEEYGATHDLLGDLEDTFLVRKEPNTLGRHNYELSHDSLLGPVIMAKKKRLTVEEEHRRKVEQARFEAEKADAAKRQRNSWITAGIAATLVLAALASIFIAYQESMQAKVESDRAEKAKNLAVELKLKANSAIALAEEKTKFAEAAQEKANIAEQDAANQKKLADLAKKDAAKAIETAEEKTKYSLILERSLDTSVRVSYRLRDIVRSSAEEAVSALLETSRKDILYLNYDAAYSKMKKASKLEVLKDSVAFELMEIAFFQYYSGSELKAWGTLGTATALLEKPVMPSNLSFFESLSNLDPRRNSFLQKRYFPDMVFVKGGTFTMGSDDEEDSDFSTLATPPHLVTLSDFKMARTETTVWQYNLHLAALGMDIQNENIIERPSWGWEGDNPMVYVSWYDAIDYANWLSNLQKPLLSAIVDTSNGGYLPNWEKHGYRLPTEAEWEFSAKGGIHHDPFIYSGSSNIDSVGWYGGNSGNRSHTVASKKANGLGLFDMSGNVIERCWDRYDDYKPDAQVNPKGAEEGYPRVFRGGSYGNYRTSCRAAHRGNDYGPGRREDNIGFRLVLQ